MRLFRFLLIGMVFFSLMPIAWAEGPVKAKKEMAKVDSVLSLFQKNQLHNFANQLSAIFYAENLAKSIGYQAGLASSYYHQGNLFCQTGYFQKSLIAYFKALDHYRKLNNRKAIGLTKTAIYHLLMEQHWVSSVQPAFFSSLQLKDNQVSSIDQIKAQISLGVLYRMQKRYDSALMQFQMARQAAVTEAYLEGVAYAQLQMGQLAFEQEQFSIAKKELNTANLIAKQQKLPQLQWLILLASGKVSMGMSKWEEAIASFQKAQEISKGMRLPHSSAEYAKDLVKAYAALGNLSMANQWKDTLLDQQEKQGSLQVNLDNQLVAVLQNQAIQLSETNQIVAKQKEVQKNQLFIITVGTFVLIIVAVLAVLALVNYQRQKYFSRELKNKNEIIQANMVSLDLLNKEISSQNQLLEADNKTKNKLLSIISHDLRSPLVNTKGVLNLVNEGMIPPEESKRLLKVLETQYLGTTSLLDNLLFWIRGQMDGKVEETVSIKLADLIKGLANEHEMILSNKKITFLNQIPENVIVQQEKELLRIVCRNLISNAIKFTHPGGKIEMQAAYAEKGNHVMFTIRDNGIGMSEETIAKIMTKQYYNTPGTNNERGSGFGLMLCQDLIQKNRGTLSIKSELGKGTAITILI